MCRKTERLPGDTDWAGVHDRTIVKCGRTNPSAPLSGSTLTHDITFLEQKKTTSGGWLVVGPSTVSNHTL